MVVHSLPLGWIGDAGWLVQAVDPVARLARLVRMSADDYRNASFLDDRMLAGSIESRLCNLDDVLKGGRELIGGDAGWIFHIGHVGSTLLSRLLGEIDGSFAVREPRALRDLIAFGDLERPDAATSLTGLMSRCLPGGARPVVKATSFVSEYAPLLLSSESRAIFLYASPRNYIASILAGPNSVKELQALEQVRIDRLAARAIQLEPHGNSDADRAAAAWLTEMTSLEHAASGLESRTMWLDFDRMLLAIEQTLSAALRHVGLDASPDRVEAIANGPLMRRYSKAMEYEYSPRLRQDLLADANLRYGPDIDRAMDWLKQMASRQSVLGVALARAE